MGEGGMSLRAYIATAQMSYHREVWNSQESAQRAVEDADNLIAELAKGAK
jgi:hypothetical protein